MLCNHVMTNHTIHIHDRIARLLFAITNLVNIYLEPKCYKRHKSITFLAYSIYNLNKTPKKFYMYLQSVTKQELGLSIKGKQHVET